MHGACAGRRIPGYTRRCDISCGVGSWIGWKGIRVIHPDEVWIETGEYGTRQAITNEIRPQLTRDRNQMTNRACGLRRGGQSSAPPALCSSLFILQTAFHPTIIRLLLDVSFLHFSDHVHSYSLLFFSSSSSVVVCLSLLHSITTVLISPPHGVSG